MAEVRLEVTVNGRVVGTAGLDGAGYLNVFVRASRIEGDEDPFHPGTLPIQEESELVVGGHDLALGDMHWASLRLVPGDEVSVRLLGPGAADPPAEVALPGKPYQAVRLRAGK